jgi:hypothetical protein
MVASFFANSPLEPRPALGLSEINTNSAAGLIDCAVRVVI